MAGLLERIADWARANPRISALVLGFLSATGFAPLGLWPVALLAMGGFALLLQRTSGWREAALLGWLFGVAHFTFGNNWIATAFTYQAEMPAVLGWVAVPLLSLYLAIYPALAALAARVASGIRRGLLPIPVFAAFWILTEWLRSWVFTGYAWNPFGVTFLGPFDRPGLAALAPYLGTYALSGLAVLVSGGLALVIAEKRWITTGVVAALLAIGMYFPAGKGGEGTLPYTLVQPNIRQEQLNEPQFFEQHFVNLARLTLPREPGSRRLVLWPESGVPDYLQDGYPQRFYDRMTALGSSEYARNRIARVIGTGSLLLTGAVDLEIEGGSAVGAYNSVTALDDEGAIVASYSKSHLVPYGEYLPMRSLLEPIGMSRLVAGTIDFIPGPGPRTLDLGDQGRAGIQICYEIVFSGQVTERRNRPDYIFNPSNDGWFGAFGPPQHLAQARLRAIEEGLPVLRATTTGISAIVDARGVVREYAAMNTAARLEGMVPPALAPTPFARVGNLLPLLWAFALASFAVVAMRRRGR